MTDRLLGTVVLLVSLAACGGSEPTGTPTSFLPVFQPITGGTIDILAPIDTTTGAFQPANIHAAVDVPAGDTRFRWELVAGADRYVLLLDDFGDLAGAEAGQSLDVATYAQFTVTEPETIVLLEQSTGSMERTLVLQVFAYAGRELVGQSEAWALAVVTR